MRGPIFAFSVLLCLTSAVLLLVGTIGGYKPEPSTDNKKITSTVNQIRNVYFKGYSFSRDNNNVESIYGALQAAGYMTIATGQPTQYAYSVYSRCGSDNSQSATTNAASDKSTPSVLSQEHTERKLAKSSDPCYTAKICNTAGMAATGLYAVSFVLTFIITILQVMRMFNDGTITAIAIILLSILAIVFTVAATGNFVTSCINAFEDNYIADAKLENVGASIKEFYGPGFACPLTAIILLFGVTLINAFFCGSGTPPPATGKSPAFPAANRV